uniref:Uncharacterized protein n=1 Tax=Panagrolaimus sp. ES5 TaxID=591445 RepID=A0AC34GKQ7_9BILA
MQSAIFSIRSKRQADLTSEPMPRSNNVDPLDRQNRGY